MFSTKVSKPSFMFSIRCRGSPVIIRYYPHSKHAKYQYYFCDQDASVFEINEYGMTLTCLNTSYQSFQHLTDLFFFVTKYCQRMPNNLEDVFEISRDRKVWTIVKRPFIHAPIMYLQSVSDISSKQELTHRFTRRRCVPKHGVKTMQKQSTFFNNCKMHDPQTILSKTQNVQSQDTQSG